MASVDYNPINAQYDNIIVILDDGNEILMKRCKKCDYVVQTKFSSKYSHSKWCAHKWSFRYVHGRPNGSGVIATCLHCQIELNRPNDAEMQDHYLNCTQRKKGFNNNRAHIRKSIGVEYVTFDSISAMEINAQKKHHIMPGYRTTYIMTPNGIQRHDECQRCKQLVDPKRVSRESHRNQCSLPNDAHISLASPQSVSTVINNTSKSVTQCSPLIKKCCFICNTKITEAFVNIYETMTLHSRKLIYEHVLQFLNGEPSNRHTSIQNSVSNWNLVCWKCFNKINEYDLACVTAMRLGQDLKRKLSQTETFYMDQQNVQTSNESELIIGMPLESESQINLNGRVKNEHFLELKDDEIVTKFEKENN